MINCTKISLLVRDLKQQLFNAKNRRLFCWAWRKLNGDGEVEMDKKVWRTYSTKTSLASWELLLRTIPRNGRSNASCTFESAEVKGRWIWNYKYLIKKINVGYALQEYLSFEEKSSEKPSSTENWERTKRFDEPFYPFPGSSFLLWTIPRDTNYTTFLHHPSQRKLIICGS